MANLGAKDLEFPHTELVDVGDIRVGDHIVGCFYGALFGAERVHYAPMVVGEVKVGPVGSCFITTVLSLEHTDFGSLFGLTHTNQFQAMVQDTFSFLNTFGTYDQVPYAMHQLRRCRYLAHTAKVVNITLDGVMTYLISDGGLSSEFRTVTLPLPGSDDENIYDTTKKHVFHDEHVAWYKYLWSLRHCSTSHLESSRDDLQYSTHNLLSFLRARRSSAVCTDATSDRQLTPLKQEHHLLRLPQEVKDLIVDWLDAEGQASFRNTCRQCRFTVPRPVVIDVREALGVTHLRFAALLVPGWVENLPGFGRDIYW